jgi:hypothetical protein
VPIPPPPGPPGACAALSVRFRQARPFTIPVLNPQPFAEGLDAPSPRLAAVRYIRALPAGPTVDRERRRAPPGGGGVEAATGGGDRLDAQLAASGTYTVAHFARITAGGEAAVRRIVAVK